MMEFSQYGKRILIVNYPLTISLVLLFSKCYVQKNIFIKNKRKIWQILQKLVLLHPYLRRASLKYTRLGYGVMVTLQILVLPFLVRVRVPQQISSNQFHGSIAFFFFSQRIFGLVLQHIAAAAPSSAMH